MGPVDAPQTALPQLLLLGTQPQRPGPPPVPLQVFGAVQEPQLMD